MLYCQSISGRSNRLYNTSSSTIYSSTKLLALNMAKPSRNRMQIQCRHLQLQPQNAIPNQATDKKAAAKTGWEWAMKAGQKPDIRHDLAKAKKHVQFGNKFDRRLVRFLTIFILGKGKLADKRKSFWQDLDKLVEQFNQTNDADGLKIERQQAIDGWLSLLLAKKVLFWLVVSFLSWQLCECLVFDVPEYKNIFTAAEMRPIELKPFLEEFIPTGEVSRISFYPFLKLAIVYLHEGAVIDGYLVNQPFLHLRLGPNFLWPDYFIYRIRQAEKKHGLEDEPIQIDAKFNILRPFSLFTSTPALHYINMFTTFFLRDKCFRVVELLKKAVPK